MSGLDFQSLPYIPYSTPNGAKYGAQGEKPNAPAGVLGILNAGRHGA